MQTNAGKGFNLMKILVLHGVNLGMFGRRDKKHYGTATLADIDSALARLANELGCELEAFQTDAEGEMVRKIHGALDDKVAALVINAGAWTHYSYAIADALAMLACPIVEVHMSRVFDREEFRRHSVLAPVAAGVIAGFGMESYLLGLRAACTLARERIALK